MRRDKPHKSVTQTASPAGAPLSELFCWGNSVNHWLSGPPFATESIFLHIEAGQGGKLRPRMLTWKVDLDHLTGGFNTLPQHCPFVVAVESLCILSLLNSIDDSQELWSDYLHYGQDEFLFNIFFLFSITEIHFWLFVVHNRIIGGSLQMPNCKICLEEYFIIKRRKCVCM